MSGLITTERVCACEFVFQIRNYDPSMSIQVKSALFIYKTWLDQYLIFIIISFHKLKNTHEPPPPHSLTCSWCWEKRNLFSVPSVVSTLSKHSIEEKFSGKVMTGRDTCHCKSWNIMTCEVLLFLMFTCQTAGCCTYPTDLAKASVDRWILLLLSSSFHPLINTLFQP